MVSLVNAELTSKKQITVDIISDPNWYWAWPAKRRVESQMKDFSDKADIKIRFQPFQLYPDLKQGDAEGVGNGE